MKILHTADWHLGKEWMGVERISDMDKYIIPEIIDIALHEKVSLLIVAGDIFDGFGQDSVRHCTRLLKEHLQRLRSAGIHVAIIPGNHDSPPLFRLLEAALEINQLPSKAQILIFTRPRIQDLDGVQILGVPYLSASNFRNMLRSEFPVDTVLQNQVLSQQYESVLQEQKRKLTGNLPTILIGHFSVHGAKFRAETDEGSSETSYARDLSISTEVLLNNDQVAQYNALGHIHLAQNVSDTVVPTYYAGAPDYFEKGQEKYEPQVLLINLPERGKTDVMPIRLAQTTPFINNTITCREELVLLSQTFGSEEYRNRVLGELKIRVNDAIHYIPLRNEAYELFPRLQEANTVYSIFPDEEFPLQFESSADYIELGNPRTMFDAYVTQNNYPDGQASVLRQALDTILEDLENAS